MTERRNGWREAYYTLRTIASSGSLLAYVFVHPHPQWYITLPYAFWAIRWNVKANDEACKP